MNAGMDCGRILESGLGSYTPSSLSSDQSTNSSGAYPDQEELFSVANSTSSAPLVRNRRVKKNNLFGSTASTHSSRLPMDSGAAVSSGTFSPTFSSSSELDSLFPSHNLQKKLPSAQATHQSPPENGNDDFTELRQTLNALRQARDSSSSSSLPRETQISSLYNYSPSGSHKLELVNVLDDDDTAPNTTGSSSTNASPEKKSEYHSILLDDQVQAQRNSFRMRNGDSTVSSVPYPNPLSQIGVSTPQSEAKLRERLQQRKQFLQEPASQSSHQKAHDRLSGAEFDSHLERLNQSLNSQLEAKPKMSLKEVKALQASVLTNGGGAEQPNPNKPPRPHVRSRSHKDKSYQNSFLSRSQPSAAYSPHTYFSLKNSYNSLLETDLDTGYSGDRKPPVKETDLDSVLNSPNPMRMLTKSMGNLMPSKLEEDHLAMQRAKSQNSLAQREAIQKRLEERAGSEFELQVAKSLSRLTLPEWVGKSDPTRSFTSLADKQAGARDSFLSQASSSYVPYERTTLPADFVSSLSRELEKDHVEAFRASSLSRSFNFNAPVAQPKPFDKRTETVRSPRATTRTSERPSEHLRSKSAHQVQLRPIQSRIRDVLRESQQHLAQPQVPDVEEKPSIVSISSSAHQPMESPIVAQSRTVHKTSRTVPGSIITSTTTTTTTVDKSHDEHKEGASEMDILLKMLQEKIQSPHSVMENEEEMLRFFGQSPSSRLTPAPGLFSPDLRRDLFLLGPKIPLREYFIDTTASTLGRNEHNERTLVCGFPYCRKEALVETAIATFCSCYNCYTYYCSYNCRTKDWKDHSAICTFGRLKYWSNRMVKSLNPAQMKELVKLSSDGLARQGRGSVVMAFHSQVQAQDFVHGGTNVLITAPVYCDTMDLVKLDKTLQWPCENYVTEKSFILTICIAAPANNDKDMSKLYKQCTVLPKVAPEEPNVKTVVASFASPLLSPKSTSSTSMSMSTPISPPLSPSSASRRVRDTHVQQVLETLRQWGVDLAESHPEFHSRLMAYLHEGTEYTAFDLTFPWPPSSSVSSEEAVSAAVRTYQCHIEMNKKPQLTRSDTSAASSCTSPSRRPEAPANVKSYLSNTNSNITSPTLSSSISVGGRQSSRRSYVQTEI